MSASDVRPCVAFSGIAQSLRKAASAVYELPDFPGRIRSIEGLRGLAAVLVFLVHYYNILEPYLRVHSAERMVANFAAETGHSGVDLFFLLSGYLIYGAALKRSLQVRSFWLRRVRRIYPTFAFMLSLYLVLSRLFTSRSKLPSNGFETALYIAENAVLIPGLFPIQPIITVSWSLSFELFFYISLPIVAKVLRLSEWSSKCRIATIVGSSLLYAALFATGFVFDGGYWTRARMLMFGAGMILYECSKYRDSSQNVRPRIERYAAVAFCLLIAVLPVILIRRFGTGFIGLSTLARVFVIYVVYILLCYEALMVNGTVRSMCEWAPLRWLGKISYSYYLIHGLTLQGIALLLSFLFPYHPLYDGIYAVLMVPIFILTVIPATILFTLVERPFSLS